LGQSRGGVDPYHQAVNPHPDDDALLAGMATGDGAAAEMFVRRHAPSVIGVAMAVVSDRQVAEDVAQETFWRAWRAAATYDPRRGSVRSWLLAISRNAAIDYVRVRRAHPVDPGHLAALLGGDPAQGVAEDALMAEADAREVRAALAALPDEQRRAILLAAVGGRTAAEVGLAEGIPLGTAKTRIRTGLRRMRTTLEVDARRGL
jgi:RNA polymerase sigma factor (sigma-70 family)